MESFQEYLNEYRNQLAKGAITKGYRGLMKYIMDLKTYLKNKYPEYFVSGSIYYGYMDMTYFSFFPKSLKERDLKVAIVFVHERYRFEAWLAGANKQVQLKYWKLFKGSDWNKYHVVPTTKVVDSIVEGILADHPVYSDFGTLTKQIESATLVFIKDFEDFLSIFIKN